MKRTIKNGKKGFTLLEVVLVVAVIIIMAGVLLYGLVTMITASRETSARVSEHDVGVDAAASEVDSLVGGV